MQANKEKLEHELCEEKKENYDKKWAHIPVENGDKNGPQIQAGLAVGLSIS